MSGAIVQPKRPRYQSNERFDTTDADAASRAPREHDDALTRAFLSTPRATAATPTGLIVTGFSLTPNPIAGNDFLVRINTEVGVAIDSNGRSIIKTAGTIDSTIPVGTYQIYVYFIENETDTALRRFLPAAPPYTEYPDAIPTAFQGGVGVHLRAGNLATVVAEDVVNGVTTPLCLVGIATASGLGAVTITGHDAVTAPNGTDITNRLSTVTAPSTVPTTNTRNGSMVTLQDLITAALYTIGQTAWLGSDFLTPAASNNYGAYSAPAGGADKAFRQALGYVTIGNGTTVKGDFNTSDYANSKLLLDAAIASLPTAGGTIFLKRGVALTGFASGTVSLPAGKTVEIRGEHNTVPSNAPSITFAAGEKLVCSATGKLVLRNLHIQHAETAVTVTTSPCEAYDVYMESTATVDAGAAFQGTDVSDLKLKNVTMATVLTTASATAMLLRITGVGRRIFVDGVSHTVDTSTTLQMCGVITIADVRNDVVLENISSRASDGLASGAGHVIKIDTTDNVTEIANRVIRNVSCALTDLQACVRNDSVGFLTIENVTLDAAGVSTAYLVLSSAYSGLGPVRIRKCRDTATSLGISMPGEYPDLVIEDCDLSGTSVAIGTYNTDDLGDIVIRNNRFYGQTTGNVWAIGCATAVHIEVSGNRWNPVKGGLLLNSVTGFCFHITCSSTIEDVRITDNTVENFLNVVYGGVNTNYPNLFAVRSNFVNNVVCSDNQVLHISNFSSGANHRAGNLLCVTSKDGVANATSNWGSVVMEGNTVGDQDSLVSLIALSLIVPNVVKIHDNTVVSRWDTSAGVARVHDWIQLIFGNSSTVIDLVSITDNDFRIVNSSATQITVDWLAFTSVTAFAKCVAIQQNHLSMSTGGQDFAVGMTFTIQVGGIVSFALQGNLFERDVASPSYWFKTSFSNAPTGTLPTGGPPATTVAWADNLTIHSL